MKYAYEDMSSKQFEDLIVFICQRILGISVQGFSTGPDGARDAKFVGTAELHPSKAAPWKGTVIIQGEFKLQVQQAKSERRKFRLRATVCWLMLLLFSF